MVRTYIGARMKLSLTKTKRQLTANDVYDMWERIVHPAQYIEISFCVSGVFNPPINGSSDASFGPLTVSGVWE